MITCHMGGWNDGCSTFKFLEKNSNAQWYAEPRDPYSYNGNVHKGHNTISWLELNWHIEGKEDHMEISLIQNQEGEGKKVITCFPLKGYKANWMMVGSGMAQNHADWKVYIYR